MSAASPTPMGSSHFASSMGRRPSTRQGLRRPPSRPHMSRSDSNPAPAGPVMSGANPASGSRSESRGPPRSRQYAAPVGDSSDDEIPVPMKLSALTKALLNDGSASEAAEHERRQRQPPHRPSSPIGPAAGPMTRRRSNLAKSTSSFIEDKDKDRDSEAEKRGRRHVRSGSAQAESVAGRSSRQSSPVRAKESRENSPVRKRVVRLSTTPGSLAQRMKRSTSSSASARRTRPTSRGPESDKEEGPSEINTPAPMVRNVRIVESSNRKRRSAASSGVSSRRSASQSEREASQEGDIPEDPATVARNQSALNQGSVSRFGANIGRGKNDEMALQSSMRVKRIGKVPGSFLSGPARRGRRRQSEEEQDENGDGENLVSSQERESQLPQYSGHEGADPPISGFRDFISGSPEAKSSARSAHLRHASSIEHGSSAAREQRQRKEEQLPVYKVPAPHPDIASHHDQENEAPPTFKRKQQAMGVLADKDLAKPTRPMGADLGALHQPMASPERKPLASMSNNTPHRPAPPPPPKMSVLDMATSKAGAATAQSSKKNRIFLKVNGKLYTKLDCIGRGGSGKVYKVTAENGKVFALKRVSLEHADESTVRGYLGEIELLQKLSGVERVIRLHDCELNNEKQLLSVLMEVGELDFQVFLKARSGPEGPHKFDPVFVRYYWKEMLECLQAVHRHDIVHSDLKPQNFVLVQGRLKLIDFGIANAIRTEETVNVHRETQVGTPNFMSPESLMDSNAAASVGPGGRISTARAPKLMKLGKPSDVWSLGCILYLMVYGQPPFAHIPNQMARLQAIINWNHSIEFPEFGTGDVRVPPGLLRTMKRCLTREVHLRPTVDELLGEDDPFLYPVEYEAMNALPVTEELLGRIIQSVVQRCRDRMPTDGEAMAAWPSAYWASAKKAVGPKVER